MEYNYILTCVQHSDGRKLDRLIVTTDSVELDLTW